jgi:hypothetical protein
MFQIDVSMSYILNAKGLTGCELFGTVRLAPNVVDRLK